jgi:hypothetical protein
LTNSKVYASTFKLSYLKLSSFFRVLQVAIARGPPKSADISYKSTLKKVEFTEDEYNIGLHLPNVDFVELSVEQLVLILQKALDCEHIS